MKKVWNAVVSAFSIFSRIPVPQISWDRVTLAGTLAALPAVGVAIGAACCIYIWISGLLELPGILDAAVLTVLPVLISGGIHMDGFADTVDALSSRAEPEKKRAILKDPHAGAFAVIGVSVLMILTFGFCAALDPSFKAVLLFGISQVLARAAGSLSSLILPASGQTGMLKTFRESAGQGSVRILFLWIALGLAATVFLSPLAAVMILVAGGGTFFHVARTAEKQFGGMSGDLAGYCITLTQLAMLIGLVLAERLEALWF